jgi:hypothetical protein
MLILGAPGAGKTTLLLELARSLAEQARLDPNQPVPVLVDLAGWDERAASKRRRQADDPADSPLLAGFVNWLLDEISSRYQIPTPVGRVWLRNGRLALLLDGLDEVTVGHRDKLAPVLEELRRNYLVGQVAVTCRIQDYERLAQPLSLYGAVLIRALARQQVLDYFASAGQELAGARAAIERDEDLWGLIDSPLMLNVMALAYQGREAGEIAAGAIHDHRRELFDTYISEVLARHRIATRQYRPRVALRSLSYLAQWTRSRGRLIEISRRVNPELALGPEQPLEVRRLLAVSCLPGLVAGIAAGVGLVATSLYGVPAGLLVAVTALVLVRGWGFRAFQFPGHAKHPLELPLTVLTALLATVVATGLAGGVAWIVSLVPAWIALLAMVGRLVWIYWEMRDLDLVPILIPRWITAAVFGLLIYQAADSTEVFVQSCAVGLVGASLVQALPLSLRMDNDQDGPRRLGRIALWLSGTVLAAVLLAIGLGAPIGSAPDPLLGLLLVVVVAHKWEYHYVRLFYHPTAVLHGFLLRVTGYLPWRRQALLRYAADRYVLAPTGEGRWPRGEVYAFIHLLVRDHLADCDPDALAAKVDQRIAARAERGALAGRG